MIAAFRLVLGEPQTKVIGGVGFILAAALFALTGQMVVWSSAGPSVLATPDRAVAFTVLAGLVGLDVAIQSYALRLRLDRPGGKAGVGALAIAFLGASCCTPLLWPAALSLLGVSGVTLLGLSAALHRWFAVAAGVAALALLGSALQGLRALSAGCGIRRTAPS